MRRLAIPVVLALVVAACSSGSSSTTAARSRLPFPDANVSETTAPGSTTTTSMPPTPTTETPSPPTTVVGTEVAGDTCVPYWDLGVAGDDRQARDALRRLSIAVAMPSPDGLLGALEVLRGRSSELTPEAAAAALDSYLLDLCGPPPPSHEDRFDALDPLGVLLAGPDGVRLLDGSELVPADSVGIYRASFGDSQGGTASLLEIRGLEVIEYQEGTQAVPRDLLLGEDIRLHDVADIDARIVAVVTAWGLDDFGEPVQYLDLVPVDGSESRRLAQVGGMEFGATAVSYADGLFLVTDAGEGGGSLRVFDLFGVEVQSEWLPEPGVGQGPTLVEPYQFARFSPEGETYAYLRVLPQVGAGDADVLRTDLVVRRVSDGAEIVSVEIGGPDERYSSLDYDGHWAVITAHDGLVVVDTWDREGAPPSRIGVSNVESASLLESGLNYGL